MSFMLNVTNNAFMLNDVMPIVHMLNVVAPRLGVNNIKPFSLSLMLLEIKLECLSVAITFSLL